MLAEANKILPLPDKVRGALADMIDGMAVVADRLQETINAVEAFAREFNDAHEPEGWSAAVDDVNDWHCQGCKVSDASIEEMELDDWLFLIERNHPSAAVRRAVSLMSDNQLEDNAQLIVVWGLEARSALHNPVERDDE
jgi:hypothetical protein